MAETVGTVQSFGVLNYSGMLYNKGNARTPFLSMIGGKTKYTNSVEFVTGQNFTTEDGDIPNISETASLTAPAPSYITRAQVTNVTQIFQDSVAISYAKQSNMATLSGANLAGQTANPISDLDFQVGGKMAKLGRQIEKAFIQGIYSKATTDATVNKTRGMVAAITTNVITVGSAPLTIWKINEAVQAIDDSNAPIDDLVLWANNTTINQLNADAVLNKLTIVEGGREVNGISLKKLIFPTADVYIRKGEFLPAGTALLLNFNVIAPIEQNVPSKGNFFLEELAKVGAAEQYQIFGQIGLDHGPEWYHAKLTGISTTFTAPTGVSQVEIMNTTVTPVNTKEVTV